MSTATGISRKFNGSEAEANRFSWASSWDDIGDDFDAFEEWLNSMDEIGYVVVSNRPYHSRSILPVLIRTMLIA